MDRIFVFTVDLDKLKNSKDIDIACEGMGSWHLNGTYHSQFCITIEGKVLFPPKLVQSLYTLIYTRAYIRMQEPHC